MLFKQTSFNILTSWILLSRNSKYYYLKKLGQELGNKSANESDEAGGEANEAAKKEAEAKWQGLSNSEKTTILNEYHQVGFYL